VKRGGRHGLDRLYFLVAAEHRAPNAGEKALKPKKRSSQTWIPMATKLWTEHIGGLIAKYEEDETEEEKRCLSQSS
jgi:hypothetical protein